MIPLMILTAGFLISMSLFWWAWVQEQKLKKFEERVRNTTPITRSSTPASEKTTKIEGFRTRVKKFTHTLPGVGF